MRSLTPGSADVNGSDALGSPLAKRKKVAAERTYSSKLKEEITTKDLQAGAPPQTDLQDGAAPQADGVGVGEGGGQVASPGSRASNDAMEEEEDGEDEDDDDDDDDDDFLARELEEEWG